MKRPFALRPRNAQPERELQKRVAAMLRAYLPDCVWWSCSLSGVPLTPQAATQAKALGMEKGAPDISFVWPDGSTTYLELKAKDGSLTPEQRLLAKLLGANFAVARTWDEAKAILIAWMHRHDLRFLTDTESVRREAGRRAAA